MHYEVCVPFGNREDAVRFCEGLNDNADEDTPPAYVREIEGSSDGATG